MVALFGFFEHVEVRGLFVLRRPGGAVDALQHFVLAVSAPVGTRHLHELVHLELARRRDVRTAAEVDEVALAVERNHFAFGNRLDDFGLVMFAEPLEELDGGRTVHFFANDRDVLLRELVHARFDLFEIFGREGTAVGKVVVEAVFNRRPDRHLSIGVEFLDGLRHEVRARMADDFKTFGVATRHDGNVGIGLNHVGKVDEAAVDAPGEGSLGQTGADRGGKFRHGHGAFEFTLGPVGKSNRNHFLKTSKCRDEKKVRT